MEALVREENYHEYVLHSEQLVLPILCALSEPAVQLAVRILIDYAASYFSQRPDTVAARTVQSELYISKPNGPVLHHKYDGPAETFESVLPSILDASK